MRTNEQVIKTVSEKVETVWINPAMVTFAAADAKCAAVVSDDMIEDAALRLERFAPFVRKLFPETEAANGLIESPLTAVPKMKNELENAYGVKIPGRLMLKKDSHLAIAGSVKARGGIYEVLKHAEDLALENGMISVDESYEKFDSEEMREFFGKYTMQVGSTGNLGMSIGIMSAAFGFKAVVHMSADARQWKKDLLRSKGVKVIEYDDDYSAAVAEGRRLSDEDPFSYFVDDEKSVDLFLGYAVAASRLKKQLDEQGISVDEEHPLIVYVPAGVGGAPGGISYGLKRLFKDNVHCFFCEPVMCPSVLLGMATGKYEKANVHDYGISGQTAADGLACASPSGFVTRIMEPLLSGDFTVEDDKLYECLKLLDKTEGIRIEPSSCAAFAGAAGLLKYEDSVQYCEENGLTEEKLSRATQIAWATGGSMVPEAEYALYLNK